MAGNGSSELPMHYGERIQSGKLVQRPLSPLEPMSPRRAYQPNRLMFGADEPSSTETPYYASDDNVRSGGLRRRPGSVPPPPRRYSHGDYAGERPSLSETDSRRHLKGRDDGYYRDDDRPYYRGPPHPDAYERSRPPRSYRNQDTYDRAPVSASKSNYESDRYDSQDPEKGRTEWRGSFEDDRSIDGYNYESNSRHSGHNRKIDFKDLSPEERAQVLRLPWISWMHSNVKNHFVASLGEFVGTTMFLFFAFAGTQVANINSQADTTDSTTNNSTSGGATGFNVQVYLYIAVSFGFSLMVNVWVFFRISGGLFNPAVTLGMVLVGAIPIVRAACLFCAQILGSMAASAIVLVLFPTPLNVRTTLAGGTSIVQGIFIEAILTAELVFTIFMLAKEKHKATFIAPVGIGLALFIAELVGVYYTGGSLNPARSFGPCVVTLVFDREHYIYWVGPIIGTLMAVFFYKFIKMLEYEMANPGQDGDEKNDPTKNPNKAAELIEKRSK